MMAVIIWHGGHATRNLITMKTFIAFAVLAVVFVAVNAETYDWGGTL